MFIIESIIESYQIPFAVVKRIITYKNTLEIILREQLLFDGVESFVLFGLVNDAYLFDKIFMQNGQSILKGTLSYLVIKVERIYKNPRGNSTFRILVDRLWPRGLSKDKAKVDLWQKDVAPSDSLRKWFSHDETKWDEFKARYFKELEKNARAVSTILNVAKEEPITLLYGAKEEKFNNAIALKEYLERKIK